MPIRKLPEVKCSWVSFFRRPGCGSKCGIWGHIHGVLCPNHPEPLHPTHSSPQAYLPFPPLHLALLLFIHQSSDSSSTIRLNNLKVNGCHGPQGPPQKKNIRQVKKQSDEASFLQMHEEMWLLHLGECRASCACPFACPRNCVWCIVLCFFHLSMYFEASSNFGQVRFRGVAFGRVA